MSMCIFTYKFIDDVLDALPQKIQVAVDVARCLCNLVQAGNSACYHREIWAFSQLSVVVDADFARFL